MQEHSAVLKQFPAVGRRTACGHRCGPCGRGAVRGGCVRVAWGEGSAGRGVGARGPCHGGGMRGRPAPRTSGYRLSPVRRWGWVGGAVGVGSWGRGRPLAAYLWVPAFAGMTRVGCAGMTGGWLRANGFGGRACDGVGGCDGGDAPRPAPLDSCLRRNDGGVAQGERIWGARVRWGVGVGALRRGLRANGCDGMWGGRGTAPRRAPLGSRLRGNDGGAGTTVGVGWGVFGWVLGDGWLVVVAQSRGGAGRSQLGLFGCLVFLVANGLTEVQYFAVI